jgi:hypothetical protein
VRIATSSLIKTDGKGRPSRAQSGLWCAIDNLDGKDFVTDLEDILFNTFEKRYEYYCQSSYEFGVSLIFT